MRLSIAHKMLAGFVVVAVIASIAGVIGVVAIDNVAEKGRVVRKEHLPMADASMEAVIRLERTMRHAQGYRSATDNLAMHRGHIEEGLGDFSMFNAMLLHGTESEAFRDSPAGEMYRKDDMDIVIPHPPRGKVKKLARNADNAFGTFKKHVQTLMDAHDKRMNYVFNFEGRRYNIISFLQYLESHYRDWAKRLQESARFNIPFDGLQNPAESPFGKWYADYEASDPKLESLLEDLAKVNEKVYGLPAEVNKAPDADKMQVYERGRTRYVADALNLLKRAREHTTPIYQDLAKQEKTAAQQMNEASGKVEGLLGNLEDAVGKRLDAARADAAETATTSRTLTMVAVVVGLVVAIVLAIVLGRGLTKPVTRMTAAMKRLADNDLSVEIPARNRTDEIGAMAGAVQVFKDNAQEVQRLQAEQAEKDRQAAEERRELMNRMAGDLESSVGHVVQTVSSASTELQSTAQSMSSISEEVNSQATTVASAAEEAATNVSTVAASAEELSSSIQEISRQVQQANQVASNAANQAEETNQQVEGLASSAEKIGEVVNLIKDIADQTNLLALNATIEAARAGEAGKGFAVVANEVKNLANQTTKATDDISSQIQGVQTETRSAVNAIKEIGQVINQVQEITSSIASAVEEQNAATSEIARNVDQASTGTQEVTQNIHSVTEAAQEAGQASGQVLEAANQLSENAETLRTEVDKTVSQIREQA